MKSYKDFETGLLDSGEKLRSGIGELLNNMGRAVAIITAIVTVLVTFTDISLAVITEQSFTSSLLLMLCSSYIIYFSLEDAGEHLGEECEEYASAILHYRASREKINGEDIEALRNFCSAYTEKELDFRRRNLLVCYGISYSEYESYIRGTEYEKKNERVLKKAKRMRISELTPATLLTKDKLQNRSELENPEKRKVPTLILKLIPSTVCMAVTLSFILNVKNGLCAADVINGILKLSALPLIGFKGYSYGYSYAKHTRSMWIETKANILDAFLASKNAA
jgi:hypothetical protein